MTTKTQPEKFTIEIHQPFSTFTEGRPTPIPSIISGLAPYAAFSVLGGKAKHGKSSMSRCESVCIAKGEPFLGRSTDQAEVLLCSLEDPRQHVDNCLAALGYDLDKDAQIHIVSKLARDVNQTVDAIADVLAKHKHIKFVVLDTLAKVLRAKDSTNYDEMLTLCEQLHDLARQTGPHIQALAHCKKIQHDDPFDNFLGSVEVRAETDTNIVLYDHRGKRLIKSETRMGVPWDDPRDICADTVTVGETKIVTRFYLGDTLSSTVEHEEQAHEKNTLLSVKNGLVTFLKQHGGEFPMTKALDSISGRDSLKYEARDGLIKECVIGIVAGVPHSKTNPSKLRLLKPETSGLVIANPLPTSQDTNAEQPRDVSPQAAPPLPQPSLEERLLTAKNELTEAMKADSRYAWARKGIEEAQARVTELETLLMPASQTPQIEQEQEGTTIQ